MLSEELLRKQQQRQQCCGNTHAFDLYQSARHSVSHSHIAGIGLRCVPKAMVQLWLNQFVTVALLLQLGGLISSDNVAEPDVGFQSYWLLGCQFELQDFCWLPRMQATQQVELVLQALAHSVAVSQDKL
jgi:hypothetical protein